MLYFYVKENGRMIMCGIAGFASFQKDFTKEKEYNTTIVENMGKTIVHRGPDDFGTYVGEHVAFAHTRLAVMDVARGKQPMTIRKMEWNTPLYIMGKFTILRKSEKN